MRAAVVYNPVKIDLEAVRAVVQKEEQSAGWDETLWCETSKEDPGRGATQEAIDAGVDLVIAAGGDGTVRIVAETLADHDITLALLPSGTGNLLARNMDLTLDDVEHSLHTAFTGDERAIDLGRISIRTESDAVEEHAFLVMAGVGLDAQMLAATDEDLKAKVGWLAYVSAMVTAFRHSNDLRIRYQLDDGGRSTIRAHTLIVGNCGTLQGNVLLLPDATVDDGLFDILLLKPEGIGHWIQIIAKVLFENGIVRRTPLGKFFKGKEIDALNYQKGAQLTVRFSEPQDIELDGDGFGVARGFRARIDAGALRVKVPAAG
ncbi:diacylglycerol/lipid kinase family protein [Curtobacterium sp. RRHDQ10]|uniref:diacylglycerol/lipid kinase family protein n=1 Tax=Curtobacterium phyllosphaerae TaxID=3413379 RepID=UPI003BF1F2BF